MNDDRHIIPAASIHDVDIERIRTSSPEDAKRVVHLGDLQSTDEGTGETLVELCELLLKHGERDKAAHLLRCNVVDLGDEVYRGLRRLLGFQLDAEFDQALSDFQDRFGLSLVSVNRTGSVWEFMHYDFRTEPLCVPPDIEPEIGRFLRNECEIEMRYEVGGTTADIGCVSSEVSEQEYLILRYDGSGWRIAEKG